MCHSQLTHREQHLTSANKYIFLFFTLSQLLQHFQSYAHPFATRMLRSAMLLAGPTCLSEYSLAGTNRTCKPIANLFTVKIITADWNKPYLT